MSSSSEDCSTIISFKLVTDISDLLLGAVDERVEVISNFNLLFTLLIFLGVSFSIPHHAIDLFFAKTRARCNLDRLLFTGTQIFRRHVNPIAPEPESNKLIVFRGTYQESYARVAFHGDAYYIHPQQPLTSSQVHEVLSNPDAPLPEFTRIDYWGGFYMTP